MQVTKKKERSRSLAHFGEVCIYDSRNCPPATVRNGISIPYGSIKQGLPPSTIALQRYALFPNAQQIFRYAMPKRASNSSTFS